MPVFTTERYAIYLDHSPTIIERWMETRNVSEGRFEISFKLTDIISDVDIGMIITKGDLRQTQSYTKHLDRISSKEDEKELYFEDDHALNDLLPLFEDRCDAVTQIMALNSSFNGFIQLLEWWLENRDDIQSLLSGTIFETERRHLLKKEIMQSGVEILDDELVDAVSFVLGASELPA